VQGKICQYSSIARICLYALQSGFETFVDTIKDGTTGSVIFDSIRRVEQIIFNICFVPAICEYHPGYIQNFREEIRKICVLYFFRTCKPKGSYRFIRNAYRQPTAWMNFDFRLYEGCLECWILNCWRQCLGVRYLDRAILQAVTVEVARAPVFFTEPSTWNRISSMFWRAEILTS